MNKFNYHLNYDVYDISNSNFDYTVDGDCHATKYKYKDDNFNFD